MATMEKKSLGKSSVKLIRANEAPRLLVFKGRGTVSNTFGQRQRGSGLFADMISQRFKLATRKLGLNLERASLRTDLFLLPASARPQMSLFD